MLCRDKLRMIVANFEERKMSKTDFQRKSLTTKKRVTSKKRMFAHSRTQSDVADAEMRAWTIFFAEWTFIVSGNELDARCCFFFVLSAYSALLY